MKNIKRVTAFISAILLAVNGSYIYAAEEKTDEQQSEISDTSDDINIVKLKISKDDLTILENIQINNKKYDGKTDAEISSDSVRKLKQIKLINKNENDDVYLTATAEFESSDVAVNKKVTIRFELSGNDKQKYVLDDTITPIITHANISKSYFSIKPDDMEQQYRFYGEEIPQSVKYIITNANVDTAALNLQAVLKPSCTKDSTVGQYNYKIENNNNSNYFLYLSDDAKFEIIIRPDVSLKEVRYADDEKKEISEYDVTLEVPDGYSVSDSLSGKFNKSIDITVHTSKSKNEDMVYYYIKHNDKISQKIQQTFHKSELSINNNVQKITDINYNQLKELSSNTLVTNQKTLITVQANGNEIKQDTVITLYSDDDEYKETKKAEATLINGKYNYTAIFEVDADKDETKNYSFYADASNTLGKSNSEEIFLKNSKLNHLMIDKKKSNASQEDICVKYNNNFFDFYELKDANPSGYFIAIGKVNDCDSGIAKIEYKWDDDVYQQLNKQNNYRIYGSSSDKNNINSGSTGSYFEASACNRFYLKDNKDSFADFKPGKTVDFQILVPYSQSVYPKEEYHKLYLRITDNAGNISEIDGEQYIKSNSGGIDELPPEITDIKIINRDDYNLIIKNSQNNENIDSNEETKNNENIDSNEETKINENNVPINILPSGNYANSEIILAVKAEDRSNFKFRLGLNSMALLEGGLKGKYFFETTNDKIEKEDMQYFIIENKTLIQKLVIKVSDGTNQIQNTITKWLSSPNINTSISDMKSDTFIIEDDRPTVSFDSSQASDSKNAGSTLWYNGGKIKVTANDKVIETSDENYPISGINSIILSESGKEEKVVDNSQDVNRYINSEYNIDISKLSTGEYTYYVTAEDNAGNKPEKKSSINFKVDKDNPECNITAISPEWTGEDKKTPWYTAEDDIQLQIALSDKYSGIDTDTIAVRINNQEVSIDKNDIAVNPDNSEEYLITLNKSKHFNSISYDSDQKYIVSVSAKDIAGNDVTDNNTFDVYIDAFDPWIDKVDVSRFEKDENKINVLRFGIFSNTSIDLKVSAYDCERESKTSNKSEEKKINENESQIKRITATFKYEGKLNEVELEKTVNKDEYLLHVSLPENLLFKQIVKITVYDNVGKSCSQDYIILNQDDGNQILGINKNNNYLNLVVEKIPPHAEISQPEPHYSKKVNNETENWFNGFKSENIIFNVCDSESGINNINAQENDRNISEDDTEDICGKLIKSENVTEINNKNQVYTFITNKIHGDQLNQEGAVLSGRHYLLFNILDNSGNQAAASYTYYIDNTAPEITDFEFVPASVDGISENNQLLDEPEEYIIDNLKYGFYFQDDFTARIYVTDNSDSSGIKNVSYKLISYDDKAAPSLFAEGTAELETENDKQYAQISIPKGFKGRITAEVKDNVGNSSGVKTLESSFVSEDKAPDVDISYSSESSHKDGEGNDLYTEDVAVTITLTDEKSGIRNWNITQTSEKNSQGIVTSGSIIKDNNERWNAGDITSDGWTIDQTDANLVTKISKTFYYSSDDNNIMVSFDASDNCGNVRTDQTKKFTIDKTAPVIDVQCSEGYNGTLYYNKDSKAVINLTVTERNFDTDLIKATIENSYNGKIPTITFENDPSDNSRYTASVIFGEGDYVFDINGSDMAGHNAQVNTPYDGKRRFYVDETSPVVKTNFDSFGTAGSDIYFNKSKKAVISVRDHNFDPNLTGLKVYKKDSGSQHNANEFSDSTYSFVGLSDWKRSSSDSDLYTLEFETDRDSIYKLVIDPHDKSGNAPVFDSSRSDTEIYEIDKTVPVVTMKNGEVVSGKENEFEFVDVYTQSRKDDQAPTVEFDDINFDHLKYTVTVYAPEYSNARELGKIELKSFTNVLTDKKFTLENFNTDGIYAVEIKAVDKAGNESLLNKNTYIKMKNNEVLAYIPQSSIERKTGIYSFEYADGKPVSKRPDDFSDINIVVMTRSGNAPKIVLRDMNGDQTDTNLSPESKNEDMYGVTLCEYTLKSEFFTENYQNDTDKELFLTVNDEGNRIDLGKIHIDNISPQAKIPEKFKSWHWYPGKQTREIIVSDISEILDTEACKVYDNNKEIPFEYSENEKTIRFSLPEGWHNVGIHLVDTAGNVYDVQEADNIYVGNFWAFIIGAGVALIGAITGAFVFIKKRKNRFK